MTEENMGKTNSERKKEIMDNFEKMLPQIWAKARENNIELTLKYYEEKFKLKQCIKCGNDQILTQLLDYPLNYNGIMSLNVVGAICKNQNCGEQYFDIQDLKLIKEINNFLKNLEHSNQIKPLNQQSEEYRESSAIASREDDEQ